MRWLVRLLIAFLLLVVVGLAAGYYALAHSQLPLGMIAAALTAGGAKVDGLTGNLSDGLVLARLEWPDGQGHVSVIEDLHCDYSGIWDLVRRRQLTLRDLRVGRAHLMVVLPTADQLDAALRGTGDHAGPPDEPEGEHVPMPLPDEPERHAGGDGGLELFAVDRLLIDDVTLEDPTRDYVLKFSSAELLGLRIDPNLIDVGLMNVVSEGLELRTSQPQSMEIEGRTIRFPSRIEGTVKPDFSKHVLAPITFTGDLYRGDEERMRFRLTAWDNSLRFSGGIHQPATLEVDTVDVAKYLAWSPYKLPHDLSLRLSSEYDDALDERQLQIAPGSFRWGRYLFEIQPGSLVLGSAAPAVLVAVANSEDRQVTYKLTLVSNERGTRVRQQLVSEPALEPKELLAELSFGKPCDELNPAQRKRVESLLPVFFPKSGKR